MGLLMVTLECAVPLHIFELQRLPWEVVERIAKECGQTVAEKGDVIQFYEKGKTGPAFNALARGLACLAFAPGGVRYNGARWKAKHPDCPRCDHERCERPLDAAQVIDVAANGPLRCPHCARPGCAHCMPEGRGLLCPQCSGLEV